MNERRGHAATPGLESGLELIKNGAEALGRTPNHRWVLAPPEAAGHQHHITMFLGAELLQPLLTGAVIGVAEQPELFPLRSQTAQQQLRGGTEQMAPAGVNAQLHLVAPRRVIGDPAGCRHGLIALGIDQQPAVTATALEKIFDAAIEHLAKGSRAGGLLQVPEQGRIAPLQREIGRAHV